MHTLICGTTECGKTTLARIILNQWIRINGNNSAIVFDPLTAKWPVKVYHDVDTFLALATKEKSKLIIVDESGTSLSRFEASHNWLATQSRHRGHSVVFISQRPALLSPTIRNQCSMLFCFCVSENDAISLASDFVEPELIKAPTLKQFHCIKKMRFKKIELLKVSYRDMTIRKMTKNHCDSAETSQTE